MSSHMKCIHVSVYYLYRFLIVQPTTTKDVELLTSVLQFLTTLLGIKMQSASSSASAPTVADCLVEAKQLVWLVEVTCHEGAMCVQLLHSSLHSTKHRQHSTPQRYSVCLFGELKSNHRMPHLSPHYVLKVHVPK